MAEKEILVLSNTMQKLGKVSIEKAITLIFLEKARSLIDTDKVLHSQFLQFPVPKVIVVNDIKFVKSTIVHTPTKKGIFERDGWRCKHCGNSDRSQLTLDHYIPKSRFHKIKQDRKFNFGVNSWNNLMCLCLKCNQIKSSKLISELKWNIPEPKRPISIVELNWEEIMKQGD